MNARNAELKTPLHLAVLRGDLGVTQAICDHGGLVNAADEDGLTALHVAANQGLLETTQELIARGANVNAQRQACILTSCLKGCSDATNLHFIA